MSKIHIVLVEPEIPQNTGNIARTCAATGAALHLVEPMGFTIDDKKLKRAGLDYWHLLDISYYEDLTHFWREHPDGAYPAYFLSTKAQKVYSEATFEPDCYLFFGKETKGLPERLLHDHYERTLRIPMISPARSLNLSNSVAIVVYEALRQQQFATLQKYGALREHFDP